MALIGAEPTVTKTLFIPVHIVQLILLPLGGVPCVYYAQIPGFHQLQSPGTCLHLHAMVLPGLTEKTWI